MQCLNIYDIDKSNESSFPIRLLGEICSFSCDLLNMTEDEDVYFMDNELIFQFQSTGNKQTYFCDYINDKILLNTIIPKKVESTYENPFVVRMMHSYTRQKTNDIFTTPSIVFTPLSSTVDVYKVTLCIDVLINVDECISLGDLTKLFIRCVNKQILDFKKSYSFQYSYLGDKRDIRLIALHFMTESRFLTLIVPEKTMMHEEDIRRQISRELKMEKCLQRTQSLYPPQDVINRMTCGGEKLMNPHSSLVSRSGHMHCDSHVVKGRYTYYHYLQDGIDDKNWGCAYRSLQTIVSWYAWQGWTVAPVPSLRDIQTSLVRVKDKEPSFIGSRAWIGSFEISLVLQDLLGIECRILSLTKGADLPSVYDQLAAHFDDGGAPVMIGGGQLAHTILGVARDRSVASAPTKIRFLVLDPHYKGSGPGDLTAVLAKGWCAWREASFWKEALPYNLCVPLMPSARDL